MLYKTKYKKCLQLLDEQISIYQDGYNRCCQWNVEEYNTKNPDVHDELIIQNLKLMDKRLIELEALWTLKRKIQSEIGM